MKKIKFEITVEEGNLIFKGLSKLPFEEVYELIGKLNEQANRQLGKENNQEDKNGPDNLSNFLENQ
ncbi:hypothetical protein E1176_02370 [Fulvivirga sp. RKSG066]|uniref:hypothetical protein n=1 Tax=Fulvivirga aurantia TaxID=2529383 RepID=UPI0012BB9F52|nr:hypothetical protein [Fulvivirga aurantia]MTI19859.1 hypothetical protein [Fulvivirga aurantia]